MGFTPKPEPNGVLGCSSKVFVTHRVLLSVRYQIPYQLKFQRSLLAYRVTVQCRRLMPTKIRASFDIVQIHIRENVGDRKSVV